MSLASLMQNRRIDASSVIPDAQGNSNAGVGQLDLDLLRLRVLEGVSERFPCNPAHLIEDNGTH